MTQQISEMDRNMKKMMNILIEVKDSVKSEWLTICRYLFERAA